MKDKEGNKLTTKEFFGRWWKGIIEAVMNPKPIQKLTSEVRGTLITLVGFVISTIALIIFRDKLIVSWFAYGLILVFIGNIITNGLKWLSLRQQLKYFKNLDGECSNIDDIMNKLDEEEDDI